MPTGASRTRKKLTESCQGAKYITVSDILSHLNVIS